MGSGNDFARALGLTERSRFAIRLADDSRAVPENVRPIDLGVVSERIEIDAEEASTPRKQYFCCVAGVGLDCEVARKGPIGLPRWLRGNGGYVLALAPTIFTFAPFAMKIFTSAAAPSTDNWTIRSESTHPVGRLRQYFNVR